MPYARILLAHSSPHQAHVCMQGGGCVMRRCEAQGREVDGRVPSTTHPLGLDVLVVRVGGEDDGLARHCLAEVAMSQRLVE